MKEYVARFRLNRHLAEVIFYILSSLAFNILHVLSKSEVRSVKTTLRVPATWCGPIIDLV